MMNNSTRWILTMILFAGIGCQETDKKKKTGDELNGGATEQNAATVNPVDVEPQTKPQAGQYCYIKKIDTGEGITWLEADYIQFLMGDEAIAAAKQHGDAIAEVDKQGDTVYSLPSNYYIRNDNTKIRKLSLSNGFEYIPVMPGESKKPVNETPVDLLRSRLKDQVFVLTVNDNNVVTRIKEQFLP